MNPAKRREIFRRFAAANPHPTTELEYGTPFELLVELHDSQVPPDRAALEALPGVGRKTANVILNTAFGQPTMAVDTHIFRVANRTGLAPRKTVLEVEKKLLKTIPPEFLVDAHT